jgi:hypothetical protein
VSARTLLVIGLILLVVVWATSGTGVLRRTPALLRLGVAILFVLAAVRIGLSIAILAFDLSPVSILIPVAMGLLAWWFRPGRSACH